MSLHSITHPEGFSVILDLPVTLHDQYRAVRLLGAGSYAETYLATDQSAGRDVAVKVLRPGYSSDPDSIARFEREALATEVIHHPNVVQVLDHALGSDPPFLVMEYVPGSNLKEVLLLSGAQDPECAVSIVQRILAGLEAIHHAGLIHRDIKPHNVLVTPDGLIKLCDFSIARAESDTGLTRTGTALGTAAYMAPEQATDAQVGPAADLYATGVILFELLTGHLPFEGNDPLEVLYKQVHQSPPSPRDRNDHIPKWLEEVTLRALAKDPAARFASASAMSTALAQAGDAIEDTDQIGAADPGTTTPIPVVAGTGAPRPGSDFPVTGAAPRKRPRSSTWYTSVVASGAILALLLGMAGILAFAGNDDGNDTNEEIDTPAVVSEPPEEQLPSSEQETAPIEEGQYEEPVEQPVPPVPVEDDGLDEATEEENEPQTDETETELVEEQSENEPAPQPQEEPAEESEREQNPPGEPGDPSGQGNTPDHAGVPGQGSENSNNGNNASGGNANRGQNQGRGNN